MRPRTITIGLVLDILLIVVGVLFMLAATGVLFIWALMEPL